MSTPDDIKNIIGSNEKVELYIKEKIFHPRINIDSVIITNERVILRHPHALGLKKDYTDYSYRDITNVVLRQRNIAINNQTNSKTGRKNFGVRSITKFACGTSIRNHQREHWQIPITFLNWLRSTSGRRNTTIRRTKTHRRKKITKNCWT